MQERVREQNRSRSRDRDRGRGRSRSSGRDGQTRPYRDYNFQDSRKEQVHQALPLEGMIYKYVNTYITLIIITGC
jgi:hypothetical protein